MQALYNEPHGTISRLILIVRDMAYSDWGASCNHNTYLRW
jgi:hypothetical protein